MKYFLPALLLIAVLSFPFLAHAQKPVPTTVTGQVSDSASRKAIGYATITLLDAGTLKPVSNGLTDDRGRYKLTGAPYGKYKIGISVVGYAPHLLEAFTLDSLHRSHEAPHAYISQAARQLQGVTVAAQKPLIEVKDDKIVYNVENDINKDNLTASEILRKVPMVTVDLEGNIQLKGSGNFKVYLNGKSTSMVAKNPKEALKAFPANIITNIEVITEPSAKYDGEGAAGIINIITKKKFSGYNGTVSANYNTLNSAYGGASFNAKMGNFGISSYAGLSTYRNKNRFEALRESFIPGNRTILEQSGEGKFNGRWQYGNLELSYDLDSSTSISVYGNLNGGNYRNNAPQLNLIYDSAHQLQQTGHYYTGSKSKYYNYGVGADFQKKFKMPEHQLTFSFARNTDDNTMDADNNQENDPGEDAFYHNANDELNTETTLQLDYTRPFKNGHKLETGAKTILRAIESNYEQLVRDENGKYVINPSRSNIFNYDQDVLAAYMTYRLKVFKKLSVQLGGRLEQTYINANFISSNTTLKDDYLSFIPTVNLSLPFKKPMNSVGLSYSRRLQRPWVWNLNPFVNDNDPNNIRYGNPNLDPEFNHSFGLRYNGMVKGIRLNTGLDYTFTNNSIENISFIDSLKGITSTTYANIGKRSALGLNINTGFQPTKNWNFNGNVRLMYVNLNSNNGTGLRNDGWTANGYVSSDYNLGKGFKTEGYLYFNTSRPTLQGSSAGYTGYGLTLRKELFDKKASVTISADQPFQKERVWKNITNDPAFYRYSAYYNPARAFRIGFQWKFGQLKESVSRKKGVSNDDVKQGESSGAK